MDAELTTAYDSHSLQSTAKASRRLFFSFLIFGLLNNGELSGKVPRKLTSVLYVIILSAALDLVPSTVPKGLVAFFNIFPALLVSCSLPDSQLTFRRKCVGP